MDIFQQKHGYMGKVEVLILVMLFELMITRIIGLKGFLLVQTIDIYFPS